jgi:nucleoside-diphosphate-sugar epimerase
MATTPPPSSPALSVRRRQSVLLTGASGVVGAALLPRLADVDLTCLVHRTPVVHHGVTSVAGDLTQPRLGLPEGQYRALTREVDAVIHCAAVTDFNRKDGSLEATNIGGTENVIAFAEAAEARLYHVSTAYLHAEADGNRGETAVRYAASKRAGEKLVAATSVPHVILRPSIVIGDSITGEVESFQGLYLVAGAILSGLVPLIPFDPSWPIDFIPTDVVADAIAAVVSQQLTEGEFWLTAGDNALLLGEAVALTAAFGSEIGAPVDVPRFVPPEMFDRLIGPVFLEFLPRKVRYTVTKLLEFFTAYLSLDTALPSSLGPGAAGPGLPGLPGSGLPGPGLPGAGPGLPGLPDQRQSLLTSLRYWAAATGRDRSLADAQTEVA